MGPYVRMSDHTSRPADHETAGRVRRRAGDRERDDGVQLTVSVWLGAVCALCPTWLQRCVTHLARTGVGGQWDVQEVAERALVRGLACQTHSHARVPLVTVICSSMAGSVGRQRTCEREGALLVQRAVPDAGVVLHQVGDAVAAPQAGRQAAEQHVGRTSFQPNCRPVASLTRDARPSRGWRRGPAPARRGHSGPPPRRS